MRGREADRPQIHALWVYVLVSLSPSSVTLRKSLPPSGPQCPLLHSTGTYFIGSCKVESENKSEDLTSLGHAVRTQQITALTASPLQVIPYVFHIKPGLVPIFCEQVILALGIGILLVPQAEAVELFLSTDASIPKFKCNGWMGGWFAYKLRDFWSFGVSPACVVCKAFL